MLKRKKKVVPGMFGAHILPDLLRIFRVYSNLRFKEHSNCKQKSPQNTPDAHQYHPKHSPKPPSQIRPLISCRRKLTWSTSLCGKANTHDGREIHSGFWIAAMDVQDIVITAVASALAAHPSYRVVTTGHSLGVAVLHCWELSFEIVGISLILYDPAHETLEPY
jgi:hypothetical protein